MDTGLELLTVVLFGAGSALQVMSPGTLSVSGVALATLAMLLAAAARRWKLRRRAIFDFAIRSHQGDAGGGDATEDGDLDRAEQVGFDFGHPPQRYEGSQTGGEARPSSGDISKPGLPVRDSPKPISHNPVDGDDHRREEQGQVAEQEGRLRKSNEN
jgi:hypothetical protein